MWLNQHILTSAMEAEMVEEDYIPEIPYVAAPDALRMYYGPRPYTHFEYSPETEETSWCKFPEIISRESIENSEKFLTNHAKAVLGDDTKINVFVEHNQHLPELYYRGVFRHLCQDNAMDTFVREQFDCTNKAQDIFFDKRMNRQINGKEMREIVDHLEHYGYYLLARTVHHYFNIKADNNWINSVIKPTLLSTYPAELAENTFKFMTIPEPYNTWISSADWSHLNAGQRFTDKEIFEPYLVAQDTYNDLYSPPASLGISPCKPEEFKETSYF